VCLSDADALLAGWIITNGWVDAPNGKCGVTGSPTACNKYLVRKEPGCTCGAGCTQGATPPPPALLSASQSAICCDECLCWYEYEVTHDCGDSEEDEEWGEVTETDRSGFCRTDAAAAALDPPMTEHDWEVDPENPCRFTKVVKSGSSTCTSAPELEEEDRPEPPEEDCCTPCECPITPASGEGEEYPTSGADPTFWPRDGFNEVYFMDFDYEVLVYDASDPTCAGAPIGTLTGHARKPMIHFPDTEEACEWFDDLVVSPTIVTGETASGDTTGLDGHMFLDCRLFLDTEACEWLWQWNIFNDFGLRVTAKDVRTHKPTGAYADSTVTCDVIGTDPRRFTVNLTNLVLS
jgi:hypothetical protein